MQFHTRTFYLHASTYLILLYHHSYPLDCRWGLPKNDLFFCAFQATSETALDMRTPLLRTSNHLGTGHRQFYMEKLWFSPQLLPKFHQNAQFPLRTHLQNSQPLHCRHVPPHQAQLCRYILIRYLPTTWTLFPECSLCPEFCSCTLYIAGLQAPACCSHILQTCLDFGGPRNGYKHFRPVCWLRQLPLCSTITHRLLCTIPFGWNDIPRWPQTLWP